MRRRSFELAVTRIAKCCFVSATSSSDLPLRDFKPDAIVLGCSSGSFRFDNLVFSGAAG